MEEVDGIETGVLDLNIEVDGYIDIGMANIFVGSLVNGSADLGDSDFRTAKLVRVSSL